MKNLNQLIFLISLAAVPLSGYSSVQIDTLLNEYKKTASAAFSIQSGKNLWKQEYKSLRAPTTRSCTSCHTSYLLKNGKHIRTKKMIEPLAQSVNTKRFLDTKKIRKWLKRNCKWTLGRECTNQEKGDILTYLKSL